MADNGDGNVPAPWNWSSRKHTTDALINDALGVVTTCWVMCESISSALLDETRALPRSNLNAQDFGELCYNLWSDDFRLDDSLDAARKWLIRANIDLSLRLSRDPVFAIGDGSYASCVLGVHSIVADFAQALGGIFNPIQASSASGKIIEVRLDRPIGAQASDFEEHLEECQATARWFSERSSWDLQAKMRIEAEHAISLWEEAGSPDAGELAEPWSPLLTLNQLAGKLGRDAKTIRRWMDAGKLRYRMMGTGFQVPASCLPKEDTK